VLYFPKEEYYSSNRISEGIRLFHTGMDIHHVTDLATILAIVHNPKETDGNKKATPIEGWSIL
jgi:hypothetical protein